MSEFNYADRLSRLCALLEARNLDGAIITYPANVYYLTGKREGAAFAMCSRDGAVAAATAEEALQMARDKGCRNLGYDRNRDDETPPFEQAAGLYDLTRDLIDFRAVKDETEIEIIARAVSIGDAAFAHILSFLRPGVNERDIGFEIERHMRHNGAESLSYGVMAAAGERSWIAHAHPIDNVIKYGDIIKFDFGCRYQNYCSDLSRTVFVGKPDPKLKKIYETVKRSQEIAIERILPGATVKDVDAPSRKYIEDCGYPDTNPFSLGHSVGIDIHEYPTVSYKRDWVIKENMTLSIEPGIYVEGLGGVRLEDIMVVQPDGVKFLTHASRELIIL